MLRPIVNAKRPPQKRILLTIYFNHPRFWLHFPSNALEFRGRRSAFGLSLSANPSFATLRRLLTWLSSVQRCNTPHRLSLTILASTRRSTPFLLPGIPTPSPSLALIQLTATGRCASSCRGLRRPPSL